jgi:predicted nucleotidyltransferase
MLDHSIYAVVQKYLQLVFQAGIQVDRAVLFGSHVRKEADPDSDIDILVIAPEFDEPYEKERVDLLWELRVKSDSRIEPIPVGLRQWEEDDASAIIEIARREGQEIRMGEWANGRILP